MPEKLLNYDLLGTLGTGAGSTIYRARDANTGRMVALKHVKRVKPKDLRFVEQMETEYEVSRNFTHPNLRRSYQLKVTRTMLVKVTEAILVMEFVDAKPLEKGLPPDLAEVVQTFIDAASGLAAMHKLGWAHCDIKPNNILRGADGVVKVIDFGQSCRIGTVKERIQGTPDYIAPEQVERLPISEATDVFNLGATLYWALTGKHVPTTYHAKRAGENSFVLDALFKSPRELNRNVPEVISDVVMQSVLTNARKRPQSMDEFVRKLEIGRHIIDRQQGQGSSGAADLDDDSVFDDTNH